MRDDPAEQGQDSQNIIIVLFKHIFTQLGLNGSYINSLYIIRSEKMKIIPGSLDHISAVWFVSLQISVNCRERRGEPAVCLLLPFITTVGPGHLERSLNDKTRREEKLSV